MHGDGVGAAPNGDDPVFIPFALPGETWALDADGAVECLSPHEDRQPDRCSHFMACGGCIAQHMPEDLYLAWKRGLVVAALARVGLDMTVAPMAAMPLAGRRRAIFTAERQQGNVRFGFHARASHDVVDVKDCAIVTPAIHERLDALRNLAETLTAERGRIRLQVIAARAGLSVSVSGDAVKPDAGLRADLAACSAKHGIARLVCNSDDIVAAAPPTVTIDDVAVPIPDETFLQATAEAEAAMTEAVTGALTRARRIADLFSGLGTFALALSRSAQVTAFDSDRAAVAALTRACAGAMGRKPVTATVRDLFREPLGRRELSNFDGLVFDPPRAGAKEQAERIAASDIPDVVAVSCNPTTFARDARILVDGGYAFEAVTPIDQFVFTEHVEVVGVFRKPRRKHGGRRRR